MGKHNVHVVQLQAPQRGAQALDDVLAREAARGGRGGGLGAEEDLGGDHDVAAGEGELLQDTAAGGGAG